MTDAEEAPRRKWHHRTVLFKKRWMTAGAVIVVIAGVWVAREPIADRFITDQLGSRGVPAQYQIDAIGFRSERLSNVVIGDPSQSRPDRKEGRSAAGLWLVWPLCDRNPRRGRSALWPLHR